MGNNRRVGLLGKVFIGIAAVCVLLSMPCLLGGLLGLLGFLADVSPEENRQMGFQSLWIAAIPLGLSLIALLVGLALLRHGKKERRVPPTSGERSRPSVG